MLQCCSYDCPQMWTHLACTNLQDVPNGDWYCSQVCEDSNSYVYCTCHNKKGGKMVQCELKARCLHNEWYHVKCLSPAERKKTKGKIYCVYCLTTIGVNKTILCVLLKSNVLHFH